MALNDILKHMPSMGFDFSDFAPEADMDFMGSPHNFRVLDAPPFKNVSFAIASLFYHSMSSTQLFSLLAG